MDYVVEGLHVMKQRGWSLVKFSDHWYFCDDPTSLPGSIIRGGFWDDPFDALTAAGKQWFTDNVAKIV